MYHMPTGKIYVGSLKDKKKFKQYKTHSKTVKRMMTERPCEWQRYIVKEFPKDTKWYEVVLLEQLIIKHLGYLIGWENLFNKGYYLNHVKLVKGVGKPHAGLFKKGHKTNNGRKQSPEHIKNKVESYRSSMLRKRNGRKKHK